MDGGSQMHRLFLSVDDVGMAGRAPHVVNPWRHQDARPQLVVNYVTETVLGRFPGTRVPMSYEHEVAQRVHEQMTTPHIQFLLETSADIASVKCRTTQEYCCDTIVLRGAPAGRWNRWRRGNVAVAVLAQWAMSVVVMRPPAPIVASCPQRRPSLWD